MRRLDRVGGASVVSAALRFGASVAVSFAGSGQDAHVHGPFGVRVSLGFKHLRWNITAHASHVKVLHLSTTEQTEQQAVADFFSSSIVGLHNSTF